jgi:DNA-binding MarR family transcriptional regulator
MVVHRELSDSEKQAASLMRQMVLLFAGESKRSIPLGHIETFLLIAADEGHSVNEYADRAGVSKSVMSRQTLDIGDATRAHEPGLQWVTSRVNPMERRSHQMYLTPKGRALAHRLQTLLDRWRNGR